MYEYPKQILTISEQIQSYVDAGMIIDSYENVKNAMKSIGYYRLKGNFFYDFKDRSSFKSKISRIFVDL